VVERSDTTGRMWINIDPGGIAAASTLPGSMIVFVHKPVVSLRSTTG